MDLNGDGFSSTRVRFYIVNLLGHSHCLSQVSGWTDGDVDRKAGVSQISKRSPRRGDLILANWTSYVEVLYLAFR